ncbi:HD-GYP domain-containing protein [Paenibacillus puldeungensis]|uniref:HD-GYP domain-containing protein n=1 Tax=Paenibacillus puldeungensis TaxID=696536 RepID=A0ABW3S2Q5_9BACL
MRLIPISEYNENTMQLAKAVYDGRGRVLLAANHSIHPKILDRFAQMGISHIVIEDADSKGITLEEMLDIPTWLDLIALIKQGYEATAQSPKNFPIRQLLQGAGMIVDEVKRRPIAISVPVTTLAGELQPYAHTVNVTLLAIQMAKQIAYNDLQLRDLAVGCLLHDIGKMLSDIPERHPEAGFNFLRGMREINLLSAHVAFQHHETYNGTGYPRKISGKDIHEYAQLCGLADFYENLTSIKHVPPYEAVEVVMALNGTLFAEKIVQAFIKGVAPYPPGTKVKLNNGESAIITRIVTHMQRPVVRFLTSGEEISLAEHPTLMITV